MNQGVALSVSASVLFALVYYTSSLLYPLEGADLFAWRIFLGVPGLALIVHQTRRWPEVWAVAKRFFTDWRFLLLSLISAFLFGVQLWFLVWAPLTIRALVVFLGFFLLLLTMVWFGKVLFN